MKWEYLVDTTLEGDAFDVDTANKLGEEGWELVCVHGWYAVYKRPLK